MLKTIFVQESKAGAQWDTIADALREKQDKLDTFMDAWRDDVLACMSLETLARVNGNPDVRLPAAPSVMPEACFQHDPPRRTGGAPNCIGTPLAYGGTPSRWRDGLAISSSMCAGFDFEVLRMLRDKVP